MLELVIGLFIFAVGMLSLASLQGQLLRSQADAAVRSVATNIAEEQVEFLHGFGLIDNNPDNLIPAYTDIVDKTFSVTRGNAEFLVDIQVTDYYYNILTDRFSTTNLDDLKVSDFKDTTITSGVAGLRATDIQVEGDGAFCNRSPDGYACEFPESATDVTLKIYNYKKKSTILAACSLTLTTISSGTDATGRGFTYFSLSPSPALSTVIDHDISIQADSCS